MQQMHDLDSKVTDTQGAAIIGAAMRQMLGIKRRPPDSFLTQLTIIPPTQSTIAPLAQGLPN